MYSQLVNCLRISDFIGIVIILWNTYLCTPTGCLGGGGEVGGGGGGQGGERLYS